MFSKDQFPNNMIQQYLNTTNKLKKFERVVFKRFAPNVTEVSSDYNRLAVKFDEACIFQYAAMCYLGAAKCEKILGNAITEVDFLLKSARAFVKADQEIEKLDLRSNKREYIEGALKSYTQALSNLDDDSVLKAAVIREIRTINPNFESTSNFASPCHRIHDLHTAAYLCITKKDYVSALEKLTDIFDNITERKQEALYQDIMMRTEITRILLLLALKLPPSRQSPSHIKLLEKYANVEEVPQVSTNTNQFRFSIPTSVEILLKDLVMAWQADDIPDMSRTISRLFDCKSLKPEHRLLLDELGNMTIATIP